MPGRTARPECFNGAVARTRRSVPITLAVTSGNTLASMEPSRERDGVVNDLWKVAMDMRASMEPSRERDGVLFTSRLLLRWRSASMEPSRERDGVGFGGVQRARVFAASMEPSRERDGVLLHVVQQRRAKEGFNGAVARTRRSVALVDPIEPIPVGLQWSRRANATECSIPPAPPVPRKRFNGAVARTRRSVYSGELARAHERLASMEPSRERDGVEEPRLLLHPALPASMEPSRERDGVRNAGRVGTQTYALQWSRRANATE